MDLSFLNDLLIGGVGLVPLVIGLVSLAKRLGMPDEYAPWLNGGLSALGYLIAVQLPNYPELFEIAKLSATATMIFLASSGTYQLHKSRNGHGDEK